MILSTEKPKKLIFLLALALLMLAGGCSALSDLKTQSAQTATPVSEELSYKTGYCRIDGVFTEYGVMSSGEKIEIFDEDDDFYYFTKDNLILAVDKDLVHTDDHCVGTVMNDNTTTYFHVLRRGELIKALDTDDEYYEIVVEGVRTLLAKCYVLLDSEEAYSSWVGYTVDGACVYADYGKEKKLSSFGQNEEVEVIDELDSTLIIKIADDTVGYMRNSDVTKNKTVRQAQELAENTPVTGDADDGGMGTSVSEVDDSLPLLPVNEPESVPEWTNPVLYSDCDDRL